MLLSKMADVEANNPLSVPEEGKDRCCGLFCIGVLMALLLGPFAFLFLLAWEPLFVKNGLVWLQLMCLNRRVVSTSPQDFHT